MATPAQPLPKGDLDKIRRISGEDLQSLKIIMTPIGVSGQPDQLSSAQSAEDRPNKPPPLISPKRRLTDPAPKQSKGCCSWLAKLCSKK